MIRRIPKRGFRSKVSKEFQIVNLKNLESIKEKSINPALLQELGLIKSKTKPVKILGDGEIKAALTVLAHAFSKSAQDKIKNAGGSVEVLNA